MSNDDYDNLFCQRLYITTSYQLLLTVRDLLVLAVVRSSKRLSFVCRCMLLLEDSCAFLGLP